jgi:hypothetical protein
MLISIMQNSLSQEEVEDIEIKIEQIKEPRNAIFIASEIDVAKS